MKRFLSFFIVFVFSILFVVGCDTNKSQKTTNYIPKETKGNSRKSEVGQKYLPLAVGNTWTYKRTIMKGAEIFNYTKHYTEEASYFSVGRVTEELPEISSETYLISGKEEIIYNGRVDGYLWNVKVDGIHPRDGRYSSYSVQEDPNIRWTYTDDGDILEIMDGRYLHYPNIINRTTMAIFRPWIVMSPATEKGEFPYWSMGSIEIRNKELVVPAGTFSNYLKSCTLINGKNLGKVLMENAKPEYWKDFGCFITESFFVRGVGLVKEVQYNADGNAVYILELASFKINKE